MERKLKFKAGKFEIFANGGAGAGGIGHETDQPSQYLMGKHLPVREQ